KQNHGQQVWSGEAARRHVERCRRLRDLLAFPARELFPHRLNHLPLPRDHLQRLGNVLAQLRQLRRPAAGTAVRRGNDDALARQMIGERLAGRPLALERLHRLRPGRRIFGRQDPPRSQGAITAGTVLGTRKATVLRAGRYRCQCERVVIAAPDRREGIDLSVSTLADRVGACTTALRALHALIERHVLAAAERQARMITTPATPALEGTAQGRARLLERRHVVAGWRIATLFYRLLHC